MEEDRKEPNGIKFTQSEIDNFKGLTEEERFRYGEFFDFLCRLVDEQTDPWVVKAFVVGKWSFEIKNGLLAICYNPDELTGQQRDHVAKQVFDALDRTPNRYFNIVKEH